MRSPSFLTNPIKISVLVFTFGISGSALAESYLVYPDTMGSGCCRSACASPCGGGVSVYQHYPKHRYQNQTPYYEMHFSSPKRHYHTGDSEMAEYAWVPTP